MVAIARHRNITCTQGSADAFIEAEEITGIDPSSARGWMLTRLEVMFSQAAGLQGLSADSAIQWALTRDTKAALASLDDSDVIVCGGIFNALTTSGEIVVPSLWLYEFPAGVIVVEPSIYMHLDSAATGLTLTAHARLYYEEVKLSEVEILRMLTQG